MPQPNEELETLRAFIWVLLAHYSDDSIAALEEYAYASLITGFDWCERIGLTDTAECKTCEMSRDMGSCVIDQMLRPRAQDAHDQGGRHDS